MTEQVLKLEDSRRLTGPNLFGPQAGAVIEVRISGYDKQQLTDLWQANVKHVLSALGWSEQQVFCRHFSSGASLGITAPIDVLYAATEINELAWQQVVDEQQGREIADTDAALKRLELLIAEESNPKLLALADAAKHHDVRFLSDDDWVSLGYGASCQVFPVTELPDVEDIDWSDIHAIPLALVTGTNGKSTTVRLAAHVIKHAGKKCGITSTDYIRIDDEILDEGDYSGPGGARTLLRHPETEVAILEVARGGMLRRGLGVNQALCAAITNVAADHLGDYGMDDVSDMVAAKFVVRQALNLKQDLILNADDEDVVRFAQQLPNQIVWFSWSAENTVVQQHLSQNGAAVYLKQGMIYYHHHQAIPVVKVVDIPMTMSGAAKHNIHNAMVVVAMMFAMDIELPYIKKGLESFTSSPDSNPGRGNLFQKNGYQVLVDFAHNEHGLGAMAQTLKSMPSNRKLVMMGQAGDRSDEMIKGLVKSALSSQPDCLIICELSDHLRGREAGVVPELMTQFALEMGLAPQQILRAGSSYEGAQMALNWAQTGDVLLLLALTDREKIIELLQKNQ